MPGYVSRLITVLNLQQINSTQDSLQCVMGLSVTVLRLPLNKMLFRDTDILIRFSWNLEIRYLSIQDQLISKGIIFTAVLRLHCNTITSTVLINVFLISINHCYVPFTFN